MTDYRKAAYALLSQLTGDRNVITIPKMLVKMTGDMNSAAVLNQILYWSDRTKDPDGWFFKTYPDWEEETGLTQYEVKRAIAGDKRRKEKTQTLQDFGVQTERRKHGRGVKLFYRIERDVFMQKVVDFANMNNVDNQQCTQSKNMNNVDNPYTETTSETTKEKDYVAPDGTTNGGSLQCDVCQRRLALPNLATVGEIHAEYGWVCTDDDKVFCDQCKDKPDGTTDDDTQQFTSTSFGLNRHQTMIAMIQWPGTPFEQNTKRASDYLDGLQDKGLISSVMDYQDVLAAVKRELITPPEEPKPDKPKKERKPNPWYDAIKETAGVEGFKNGNVQNVLHAKGKNGYAKYDLETPLTVPDQVRVFWAWYQTQCKDCDLVSPAAWQDWVMRWQSAGMPDVRKPTRPTRNPDALPAYVPPGGYVID